VNTDIRFRRIYVVEQFIPVPPAPGLSLAAVGISNNALVGGACDAAAPTCQERAFILTGDVYSFFTQPGWPNSEARAIGDSGIVTGYSYTAGGTTSTGVGFIYDPTTATFQIISIGAPSRVIAQGSTPQARLSEAATRDRTRKALGSAPRRSCASRTARSRRFESTAHPRPHAASTTAA
jgi:hypothetical protein